MTTCNAKTTKQISRMPDSRWHYLQLVLRDTADMNKHRTRIEEILKEGERARSEESRLKVWEP